MILPNQSVFERGTAQFGAVAGLPLSRQASLCKAQDVMVARPRAQSGCSARYPSPAGCCGCLQGREPCFFPVAGGDQSPSVNLAMQRFMPYIWCTGAAKTALDKPKRGKEICEHLQNGLQPSVRLHFSADAETPLASKPSWAAAQVWRRPQSPRATLPQARSLVPSATLPIVRHTRPVANGLAGALSGAKTYQKPAAEYSVAGFFRDQTRVQTRPARAIKGTDHV